jgi:hypothetical protein
LKHIATAGGSSSKRNNCTTQHHHCHGLTRGDRLITEAHAHSKHRPLTSCRSAVPPICIQRLACRSRIARPRGDGFRKAIRARHQIRSSAPLAQLPGYSAVQQVCPIVVPCACESIPNTSLPDTSSVLPSTTAALYTLTNLLNPPIRPRASSFPVPSPYRASNKPIPPLSKPIL